MSWDDVEVDFGGEETANFGPRQESGSALFQVNTLATISPRGEVICNPVIHAACGTNGFCAAADHQLSLFDDTCHNLNITLTFDSEVEVVAWSDDSMFVVVAERRGTINFLDVQSKSVLFRQSLISRDDSDTTSCFQQISFIPANRSGTCELVVLASVGTLFRFSNINLAKLNQAIDARDVPLAQKLTEEIALQKTDTSYLHTEEASFFTTAYWQGVTHIVTCGKGSSVVAIWKCEGHGTTLVRELSNDLFNGVVQCHASANGKWLFLLDDERTLSVFDSRLLVMVNYWPEVEIQEFILMNYNSVNTGIKNSEMQPELQLVVLTPGPDCYLKVFTLPGMQCTYSLAISKYCTLAQVLPSQEPIFLLEGSFQEYLSDVISVLRVRCLTEALPKTRFSRLLNKKKFVEAEKFARQFQLDIELVYKVKATDLLETASPWNDCQAEEGRTLCDELKACMEQITDIVFVVDSCIQATLPTPETMYDLLRYAKQRLQKEEIATNQGSTQSQLLTRVLNVTHRLETFQMVYSQNAYSASQWDLFLRADMLEELLRWLTSGHFTEADIIWKRHKPEFQSDITQDTLKILLNAIPENTHSTQLGLFLQQDIIPFVYHNFHAGQRLLAEWMEEKAKTMEISEKTDWPKNALNFAELFFSTKQEITTPAQYTTELASRTTDTSPLWNLVEKMRMLLHLRTKYKCVLSLTEYDQETTSTIVYRMLDRVVAPQLIPATIENTVRPYMKEHSLEEDKLLFTYIEELLKYNARQAACSYESSWEVKAIAIINCMKDLEFHILGIFTVMSCASMPWSQTLEGLVQDGLALKHPKVSILKERHQLLKLKKMLSKYDMQKVLNKHTAQTVMRYIISQDKPDSLPDALEVVGAFHRMSCADAYLFHAMLNIKKNRIDEVVNLLKTLPISEAEVYSKRLVIWAEVTLQSPLGTMDQKCIEKTELITQAAVTILHFLLNITDDPCKILDLEKQQMLIKCIRALQTEYGEFLSVPQFQDETVRKALLTKYLNNPDYKSKIFREKTSLGGERKSRTLKSNVNKIYRLGELLMLSRSELQGQLAIAAAKTGDVNTALQMAKDLSSEAISEDIARILYTVVHTLTKLCAEEHQHLMSVTRNTDNSLMADMLRLAQQAVTYCASDLMCDCMELCKLLKISSTVYQQCDRGEYGVTVQTTNSSSTTKDPYQDWPFQDFFKEDTLVMESTVVMSMVHQFTMACLPLTENDGERLPLEESHISIRDAVAMDQEDKEASFLAQPPPQMETVNASAMVLVHHLKENNQYEIALKVLLVSLGSCLQYYLTSKLSTDICNKEQTDRERQLAIDIGSLSVQTLKMYTSTILLKICGSRHVDCSLGLGYICILAKQTTLDTLKALKKNAGQNYRKILAVATIAEAFAELNNDEPLLNHSRTVITRATWGTRLVKLKINIKNLLSQEEIQSKRLLLLEIVKRPNVDVALIKEYCRSFSILDVDDALLLHLEILLLPSNHSMEGPSPLNMAAIQSVFSSVVNQDLLVQKLSDLLEKVDSYDYERLNFIMEQIKHRCMQTTPQQNLNKAELGLRLLLFLRSYTRRFEPSQYELDFQCTTEEEQLRGNRERLSPLAKTRLPYHPLLQGGQWKILSTEINEDTVEELLQITNLLRLPPDQVYVVAIQNIMSRCKEHRSSMHHSGDSSSIDRKEMDKIRKLLFRIDDPNMAIATARFVAKELPIGQEKVLALKECEMLAHRAINKCPENSIELQKAQLLHQKLSVVYRAVATEQVLHKTQLATKALMALVETPARLIFTLYEHDSIQQRTLGKQHNLPDIHHAVNEIATENNLDVNKIWFRLVNMWLPHPSASKQADDDKTMDMSLVSLDESSGTEEQKSLKRVIYVLQAGEIKTNAKFLLSYAYKVESTEITNACRVRALHCLFTILDIEDIEKLTEKPIKEIREYMKNLLYLCKLENLNISMDLTSFIKVDKEGLVRGLWRNHSRNQKAVRLVADLCIDYKIHDSQLWNSILVQLTQFNLTAFLHHVLASLAAIPDLWQIQCLPRAWRSVLMDPFTAVCAPLTEDQEDKCRQSAILLQSCPVVMSIDLISLCRQFMKVEMFSEALGCLLYIPEPEKKQNQIQALLGCQCHVAIFDEITKVEQRKVPMPQAAKIKAAVFNSLSEAGEYSILEGTVHFASMVKYLIQIKDVRGLLKEALKSGRLSDAVNIINMYSSQHPETPSLQRTFGQQTPDFTLLKWFLDTHNMPELLQYVPRAPHHPVLDISG